MNQRIQPGASKPDMTFKDAMLMILVSDTARPAFKLDSKTFSIGMVLTWQQCLVDLRGYCGPPLGVCCPTTMNKTGPRIVKVSG